jgi:hypothetical protein
VLPPTPFDGQIFVDANRVQWKWDARSWLWKRSGYADSLPLATDDSPGLMDAQYKAILDRIPPAGGGFGLSISTSVMGSQTSAMAGDITLASESLTIVPVDRHGEEIAAGPFVTGDTIDTSLMGGFKFSLGQEFLDNFCMEIVSFPGGRGDKGDKGEDGIDGFNDGPAGQPGLPGNDAITLHDFTGIKLIELDEIRKQAIVDIDLDPATNTITAHTAMVKVPSDDTPADKLILTPVTRFLQFVVNSDEGCRTTLDNWALSAPVHDPLANEADLYVFRAPFGAKPGDEVSLEVAKLSDLIKSIVSFYKQKLIEFDRDWLQEARAHIEQKDSAARDTLGELAQQLSDCEFSRPLQFAIGVDAPLDTSGGGGGGSGQPFSASPSPALGGAVTDRVLVITVIDQSIANFSTNCGAYYQRKIVSEYNPATTCTGYSAASKAKYQADLTAWTTKMNQLRAAGKHARLAILQQYLAEHLPVGFGLCSTEHKQDVLRCPDLSWPADTDRATASILSLASGYHPTGLPSGGRISSDAIMAAYGSATADGYRPTMVVFVLDNSATSSAANSAGMLVNRDYGGTPQVGSNVPPELDLAISAIRAANPGVTVVINEYAACTRRWLDWSVLSLNSATGSGTSPSPSLPRVVASLSPSPNTIHVNPHTSPSPSPSPDAPPNLFDPRRDKVLFVPVVAESVVGWGGSYYQRSYTNGAGTAPVLCGAVGQTARDRFNTDAGSWTTAASAYPANVFIQLVQPMPDLGKFGLYWQYVPNPYVGGSQAWFTADFCSGDVTGSSATGAHLKAPGTAFPTRTGTYRLLPSPVLKAGAQPTSVDPQDYWRIRVGGQGLGNAVLTGSERAGFTTLDQNNQVHGSPQYVVMFMCQTTQQARPLAGSSGAPTNLVPYAANPPIDSQGDRGYWPSGTLPSDSMNNPDIPFHSNLVPEVGKFNDYIATHLPGVRQVFWITKTGSTRRWLEWCSTAYHNMVSSGHP